MQRSPFITPPLQGSLTSFIDYGGDDNFGSGGEGGILFYNNSSADHAVIVSEAAPGVYSSGGLTEFNDQSTAGNSQIPVRGGGFSPQFGSYIYFLDSSTAGNAVITIDSAEVPLSSFASPVFDDSASAGNATFTFKAAFAAGVYAAEGSFHNTTTADHGTFFVNGATVAHGQGCQIFFYDSSTAAESTFTLNGGEGEEAGLGSIQFLGNSTAGNATITINGGTNGGQGGNCFVGEKSYGGGTARFEIFGNGLLYGGGATGSIEGDGLVDGDFIIGGNNLSTVFSGTISGSTFTKTGTGTLTLSGSNLYTDATTILQGTLLVSNRKGSGTGEGPVFVNGGTLGGRGIITGAVTVGGQGSVAFLAPSAGSNKTMTLTTHGALNFAALSTSNCKINLQHAGLDKVVANGVSIGGGASFSLITLKRGSLTVGTVFTIISNTSATPVVGTFDNLPDGTVITAGGNNLQASYEGGDGNDLTLTAVP